MSRQKIIFFIVEGITDKTCLSLVLSKIITSPVVRFEVTYGDITTRTGINTANIELNIAEYAKKYAKESKTRREDFCEIVHLVDMDGAYIPDDHVVLKTASTPIDPSKPEKLYYGDDKVFVREIANIQERNHQKALLLNKMICMPTVWGGGVPYSVYYFSCNLDHVMHNERNLFECDKYRYAHDFETKMSTHPDQFIDFLNNSSFSVAGDYNETWTFIKKDCNSLNRYTNFNLFFTNPKNPRI
jgi:hypothetical protein